MEYPDPGIHRRSPVVLGTTMFSWNDEPSGEFFDKHTEDEEANLDALYSELSRCDFSSGILEAFPDKIAVVELKGILWSDWGRRDRVLESLGAIGRLAAPLLSFAATA